MPKTKTSKTKTSSEVNRASSKLARPVVLSMGCPSGVGPEVCVAAALSRATPSAVIVGDRGSLHAAAVVLGLDQAKVARWKAYDPKEGDFRGVRVLEVSSLAAADRKWGRPGAAAGRAQLSYIEEGYEVARRSGLALVTAPVSKEVIAHCGEKRAKKFRGHTEWLEELDGAAHSVMCFASSRLVTSLVTTHLPLSKVPIALTSTLVTKSILELVDLLLRTGKERPLVAVSSLNPHAGEGKLLGGEELSAIAPGIEAARKILGRRAVLLGPIGAETAYRKSAAGAFAGVVAMYHDQATIPMKLLDFGGAVNVTQGLSIVRTSVDHGTAYDIAGQGVADSRGMREAMILAARLGSTPRKIAHGRW